MSKYVIGKVARPVNGSVEGGFAIANLTATVTKGEVSKQVTFKAYVREEGLSDTQAVAAAKDALIIENMSNIITSYITLPVVGLEGTTIAWSSSLESVISNSGIVVRPDNGEPDSTVTLTATITKGDASDTKTFECVVKAWTNREEVELAHNALTWESIKGTNSGEQYIMSNLTLPTTGTNGTKITWESSAINTISIAGVVTRPSYSQGNATVTLTAFITKNDDVASGMSKQFSGLIVIAKPVTNEEAVNLAVNAIDVKAILCDNESLNKVTGNMKLPKRPTGGNEVSTVVFEWTNTSEATSNESAFVTFDDMSDPGFILVEITRPPSSASVNEIVNFTCAARSSSASGETYTTSKVYKATIIKQTTTL